MLVGERWWTAIFKKLSDVDWAVAPLPRSFAGRRPAYMTFISLGVYAKTRSPDVAFQFLLRLIAPEQVKKLIDVGDSIPIRYGPEANAAFLADPTRPKGENAAYLAGMDDPIVYFGRETFSPYVPIEEQLHVMRHFEESMAREDVDIEAELAKLQRQLNELYAERTAPPKKPSLLAFVLVLTGVVGALVLAIGWSTWFGRRSNG